jgi:hypothetical protein
MQLSDGELRQVGRAARERALAEHTAAHRAEELVQLLDSVHHSQQASADA